MSFLKKLGLGLLVLGATQGVQAAKCNVILETKEGGTESEIPGAHGVRTLKGKTEFSVDLASQWIEEKILNTLEYCPEEMRNNVFINALQKEEKFSENVKDNLNKFFKKHFVPPTLKDLKEALNLGLPLGIINPEAIPLNKDQIDEVLNKFTVKSAMKRLNEYANQGMYVSPEDRLPVLERLASQTSKEITAHRNKRIFETVYTAFSNAMFCLGLGDVENEEFEETAFKSLFTVKVKLIDKE